MDPTMLVISTAHEVMQALPLRDERYVCMRCGRRGSLKELFSDAPEFRCKPHYEFESSGWRHDDRFPKPQPTAKDLQLMARKRS